MIVKNSSSYTSRNINTSFWDNWCRFPDWLPFQVSLLRIRHSQPLHILCPSSKCIFFCLQPRTYSTFTLRLGYYALPQQPLLYALPISTPSPPLPLYPFLSHLLLKPAFIFKDFSTQPFMCHALNPFIPLSIPSYPFFPWEGGGSSLKSLFRERRLGPIIWLISQVI